MSGAVPPPAARPPERAARVPRPACPGCGRCGHVDPAPAPQRAPLRAGVARYGGGGRASPGGVPSTVVRGAWCQALSPPGCPSSGACSQGSATCVSRVRSMRACGPSTGPTACALAGRRCSLWGRQKGVPGGGAFHRCEGRLLSGAVPPPAARPPERAARVPRPVCPGCGRCGRVDPAPAPQRAPLRAGVARCGGGGRASPGGVPSTVVRGVWCQALPLPRPLVLRSVRPGFRDPCVPGAVDAGVWTQHRPHSVRPCGPALLAVGVTEGRPRGGLPSTVVRGGWCQALSLPRPLVLRSVQPGFRDPCVPGAVDAGVWTQHRPHSVRPCGPALLAVGVAEGRPRGGAVFHRCEGRLVPGAVPPPAARPPERAARVPRPACPGCGRCGRGGPAPAPQRAPLRAGVARCGGGGRASPGGVPSTMVRGAWGQALSLSRLPAHCRVGCRGSLGVCGVCGVCAVRVVVRGAALSLVLRCSPLRCLGAVLCSQCARRVPSSVCAPCSFAGYPLFLSRLRCSLPFPLLLSLACTFSLPPLCCVPLSFSLSARASSFEPA